MSKITIVEGNSNDKDNVRVIMVKGEKGEQGDLNHNDIIDNLTSSATNKVLSANQGRVLNTKFNNYYTRDEVTAIETELNNTIDNKADTSDLEEELTILNTLINNKANTSDVAETYATKSQVQSLANGSPLVASSIAGMTDTTKTYVNTSDGNWYYYNGSQWVIGGVYQSSGISNDSIETSMLNTQMIDKYINLAYEQNTNMTKDYEKSYTTTTNKYIYPIEATDLIVLEAGTYFLLTKLKVTEMTENTTVLFRQMGRIGSTDTPVVSLNRHDVTITGDLLNQNVYCSGVLTLTEQKNFRNALILAPTSAPLNINFTVLETYLFKIDENDTELVNDITQRVYTYDFQKAYPIIKLTDNDIKNITLNYSGIEERVENIEGLIDAIPSYVVNHVNEIISSFEPPEKSLSIIFQTDHHSNNNNSNYQPAKECVQASELLAHDLPISLNIFGGDFIANGSNTTKENAKSYMRNLLKHLKYTTQTVLLRGNHDCNQLNNSALLSDTEIFNILGKKLITNDLKIVTNENIPNPMYGYIDFPFQKIRVVFVNTSDGYDQNIKIGMGNINRTQLQWLADNAFDLTGKENYQVVVFGHYPVYNFDDEETVVEDGRLEGLKQLLLAFKNGSNLNYDAWGNNYLVIKDFTSQGSKPLVAYICGHTHADRSIYTSTGLLQISTTNAGYYGKEEYVGTINEFAFDIITIDTQNTTINLTRVGNGSNRSFNYE